MPPRTHMRICVIRVCVSVVSRTRIEPRNVTTCNGSGDQIQNMSTATGRQAAMVAAALWHHTAQSSFGSITIIFQQFLSMKSFVSTKKKIILNWRANKRKKNHNERRSSMETICSDDAACHPCEYRLYVCMFSQTC